MNAALATLRGPRVPAALAIAVGAAAILGVAFAMTLAPERPSFVLETAAGSMFALLVLVAVVRLEVAAAIGLGLLAVVFVDPAPADLILVVVIGIALVTARFQPRVPSAALAALAAFLALGLLSSIGAVDGVAAAVSLATTAYLVLLASWLSGFVDSPARARLVAGAYLIAAVSSAALGAVALLVAVPGRDVFVEADRARALFQDPNVFGPFLIPIALVLVEDLLTPRLFGMRRTMKAALLGVLVLGVVLSYSRGAWGNLAVGTVVLLVVVGLRRGGGRKVVLVGALAALVAAFVGTILLATGSFDFLLERARLQQYDAGRFAGQALGIESAEKYPLGLGPGQFEHYASISAHSAYVRALAEQGVPGLFVFAVFLVSTLVAGVGNAVAGRETYGIGSAALLGAFCGVLVSSFAVDTMHWRHFWIVVALIWAGWARRRVRQAPAAMRSDLGSAAPRRYRDPPLRDPNATRPVAGRSSARSSSPNSRAFPGDSRSTLHATRRASA
jgi:O-antigen ligase